MKSFLKNLCISTIFISGVAFAIPIPFSFFKNASAPITDHLTFTTAPQTLSAGSCSGTLTIESQDGTNAPLVVGSDLTVNLSGASGISFYSDSACGRLITSTIISTGQSTAYVYFLGLSSGAKSLAAAATNYGSANQNATLNAYNYFWTGATADGLWETAGNWNGGVVPTASDTAIFSDSFCTSHCNATISSNMTAQGLRLATDYTGTITQANGVTLSIGFNGWIQHGGTFLGSNASITVSGLFSLGGGTYRATSGNWTTGNDIDVVNTTFNHNNGTLTSYCGPWAECFVTPGNANFYNVIFDCASSGRNMMNPSVVTYMHVLGNLILTNAGYSMEYGTIGVSGNVTLSNGGKQGSTRVKLVGNASGQTISGSSGDYVPYLEIDTGSNNVTLSGTVSVTMDYTLTSVGTLTTTGSHLILACADWVDCFYTPGSAAYNNVSFVDGNHGQIFMNNLTMNISGDATLASTAYGIHSGTINVSGHLNLSGPSGGEFVVNMVGNSSKTITTDGLNVLPISSLNVNKTGGAGVSLTTDLLLEQNGQGFSLIVGSLDMAAHNMTVNQVITLNSNTLTKNGGTLIVNGVTVGTGALYGGTVAP